MAESATLIRPVSEKEFVDNECYDGFELVNGELEELAMSSRSEWLGGRIFRRIDEWADANGTGYVMPQNSMRRFGAAHFRKPDALFVRKGDLPEGLTDGVLEALPTLVVEVISPGDKIEPFERKLADYRAAGIPLIWVILPATRTAHVYRRGSPVPEFVGPEGVLEDAELLPGFQLSLARLFAEADAISQ